jgi:hypothetical protein
LSERLIGDCEAAVERLGLLFQGIGGKVHCALCSIIPVGSQWIVQCGTVDHGPFMSKGIALRHAFAEAQAIRAKGQRSRVSVQDRSGKVSTEHCLCADFIAVRGRSPDVGRNSIIRFSVIRRRIRHSQSRSGDAISDRRRWRHPPLRKHQLRDGSSARKY